MAAAVAAIPSAPPEVHADAELHLSGQQVHRRHHLKPQTGWIDSPSDTPRSSSSSNNDFDGLAADQEAHIAPVESLHCSRSGGLHEEAPAGAASALNCSSSAAAVVGQWGKVLGVTFQRMISTLSDTASTSLADIRWGSVLGPITNAATNLVAPTAAADGPGSAHAAGASDNKKSK